MLLKVILLGRYAQHVGIVRLSFFTSHGDPRLIVKIESFEKTVEATLVWHALATMKQLLSKTLLKSERLLHLLAEALPQLISFLF